MNPSPSVVGRLAPSPTGGLHLGHARSFLLAWLAARSEGGRVVLRIEDIDASRVKPGAIEGILADLRWLGLDWDEGPDVGGPHAPYLQSERKGRYDAALDVLKSQELVYPCTCTRADILRAASAPHPGEEGPAYPGTCAGRSARDAESLVGRPYCWRFRVPAGAVTWRDEIRGETTIDPGREGGDFLVGRSSGEPAYQLAVVCDDSAMGISQVVRGDDLVPSTPRQILLYRAFGWRVPEFAHAPLVVDARGSRLAKRDGSIKLATLRGQGADPRRLIGLLAASCGLADRERESVPSDWVQEFAWGKVPRGPWAVPDAVAPDPSLSS